MGVLDRFERGVERAFKGTFAKAFKSEVQPVEIAQAIRHAMDDKAAILGPGRTMVPNLFTVELAPTDFDHLSHYSDALVGELVASAEEHADSQRYTPSGRVGVRLRHDETLETGVFRLRPHSGQTFPAGAPQAEAGYADYDQPYDAYDSYAEESYGDEWAGEEGYDAAPVPVPVTPPPATPYAGAAPRPGRAGGTSQTPRPPAAAAARPWLEVESRRIPLLEAMTILGRDQTASVILDDPGVSRRHAEIRVTHDGPHLVASIRDLGSTNGTFVNGEPTQTRRLRDGDRITVGRAQVVFHMTAR